MLTIYKASAGSGKTYTLAFEYIKALLGIKEEGSDAYRLNGSSRLPRRRCRHRAILAITFTNKATDEMKARIIRELNALASPDADAAYADSLCRLFGCSRTQLADEAAAALSDILNDYRHFNVSTIDSFFQTVLRTFAREVDCQGDYEVELNDRYAVAAGVGLLFDDLNFGVAPKEQQIKDWIAAYMRRRLARGRSFNIFDRSSRLSGEIVSYVHKMCGEDFKPYAADTVAYLDDPSRLRRYRCAVDEALRSAVADMQAAAQAAIEALDADACGRGVCRAALAAMLESAASGKMPDAAKFGIGDPTKAKTFKAILDKGDPKDIYTASRLPKIKGKAVYPPESLTALLRHAAQTMQHAFVASSILEMIADATDALEFLGLAWKYVADYRRDNNIVLMSDTNDLLRRIINGADVPFIYERIGVELHHFLIDEFQDTSVMQWHNLRPLVANGLAGQDDSLIIGDEKQAIYRFRNSDSSLLHHRVATEDFPLRHRIRGFDPADNTNHRSAHGIVRFNNALFSRLAGSYAIDGYENVRQSLFSKFDGLSSYVALRPFAALAAGDADPSAPKPSAAQLREASLDAMAREILRQHDDGYPWSRIAVLVRRRAEAQEVVDSILRRFPDIPLLSNEGLRLDSSAAVRLIVSVLKFVDRSYSSADTASSGGTFASYGDILMLLSRFEYSIGHGHLTASEALLSALSDNACDDIASETAGVRAARAANLPALVEVIISRNIPEQQRQREFAYIAAFQDTVLDYCAMYNPSVHAFLAWWDRNATRLTVGAAATLDAVAVMTVHKAKGLEWDCVHIPFANWDIEPRREDIWLPMSDFDIGLPDDRPPVLALPVSRLWAEAGRPFDAAYAANASLQIADNMNMTYVAFTRPVRELHVHYDPSRGIGRLLPAALAAPHASDNTPEGLHLPDGATDAADGSYIFGSPTSPIAEKTADDKTTCNAPAYRVCFRDDTRELTTIDDLTAPDSELNIGNEKPTRQQVPAMPLTPEEKARARAAERGNDLHAILARMRTEDDLTRAVDAICARSGHNASLRLDYMAVLRDAFAAAATHTRRWFSADARILAERSIYVAQRGESFRPDRIVFYPDGTIDVIDYKFTAEPHSDHHLQVRGYLAMLRAMGHTRLHGYLWYPELHLILDVTSAPNA